MELALLVAALFLIASCNCSHFRGGTISWRPTENSLEVQFTYKLGWTYGSGAGCTELLSGQYVNRQSYAWECVSGCARTTTISSAGYTCISASQPHNWEQGEYTFTYTFASAGMFTIQYRGCCWISLDYGPGGSGWNISTQVDLRKRSDIDKPNSSPVYTGYPIYSVKFGCTTTIKLQVSDSDNDNIRCKWATGNECGSACKAIPNAVLNENACTLSFTASHKAGGMYAVALVIEDSPTKQIQIGGVTYKTTDVLSRVPVQFLVETPDIPSRSCNDKPRFILPTPSGIVDIHVRAGSQVALHYFVQSTGAKLSSFALAGPPGLKKSIISSVTGQSDVYKFTVTWTPSLSQTGSHALCADATDSYGISTGSHCVQMIIFDIDPCGIDPCQNSGTCNRVGATQTYTCSCASGYTGLLCDIDIDECQSSPCRNNGTCQDLVNGYICRCVPGYTGTLCETDINECQSGPCVNNGTCFDLINRFFCGCSHGYTGEQCGIDIDDCADKPCLNGGNCTDLIGHFECDCVDGFAGEICQTGLDPCRSSPCKNNGVCMTQNGTDFLCTCVDDWEGIHCAYRHQDGALVNSTYMLLDDEHMHYSECNCYLGHDRQQLCIKYKVGNRIGYGVLGTFLGIITVICLYALSDFILRNDILCCCEDKSKQTETKKSKIDNSEQKVEDLPDVEVIPIVEEKKKSGNLHQHVPTHRHRKCWACEVKYNGVQPPRFF